MLSVAFSMAARTLGSGPVHRLVAGDLDRARHGLARGVRGQIGQFGAQTGGHPTSLWVAHLRFAFACCACVRCRIGGKRQEACQSGRMGLTANELSPSKATGGSNPLASAVADSSAAQLKTCARSSTDRASDYGSEGWGFESLRARAAQRRFPSSWRRLCWFFDDTFDDSSHPAVAFTLPG